MFSGSQLFTDVCHLVSSSNDLQLGQLGWELAPLSPGTRFWRVEWEFPGRCVGDVVNFLDALLVKSTTSHVFKNLLILLKRHQLQTSERCRNVTPSSCCDGRVGLPVRTKAVFHSRL